MLIGPSSRTFVNRSLGEDAGNQGNQGLLLLGTSSRGAYARNRDEHCRIQQVSQLCDSV